MAAEQKTNEPAGALAVDVSIVVPTYKEAENLGHLVPQIAAAMQPTGIAYEVIVVDDDSRDGTVDVLGKQAAEGYPVRLITRVGERGLSSAVIRGFEEARGQTLVCMDADMSHPPEALPRLIAAVRQPGVEFVIGSRYVPGAGTDEDWGLFRWLNSKVATLMARPFTAANDPMAGFFALPRSVYGRADELSPIGYKIGLELIVKCRCKRIDEIPIHFADRKFGQSKLSFKEQLRYLQHLKRLADFKFGVLSKFVQFCAVGATGMAVDLSIYKLLLLLGGVRNGPAGMSVWVGVSRAFAIWVAMTWNFFLNRRFTFSDGRAASILRQYFWFVASCLLGALVSWSVAMGLNHVALLEGRLFIAAIVGIIAGTVVNFLTSLLWVFRRETRRPAKATGGGGRK